MFDIDGFAGEGGGGFQAVWNDLLAVTGMHGAECPSGLDARVGRHYPALIRRLESEGPVAGLAGLWRCCGENPWLCLLAGMYPSPDCLPRDVSRVLLLAESGFRTGGDRLGELRALLAQARRAFFGEPFYGPPPVLRERLAGLYEQCVLDPVDRLYAALVEGQYGILVAFDDRLVRAAVTPVLEQGLPPEFASLRAELVATLAHAESMTGRHRRALDVLEQAHDLLSSPGVSAWSLFYLRMARANVLGLLGREAAFEHEETAIGRLPQPLLQRTFAGPFLAIWRLTFLLCAGHTERAAALAETQLLNPMLGHLPALRGEFLHYLAYARALGGETDSALETVAAARAATKDGGNPFFQLVDDLITGGAEVVCGRYAEGAACLDRVLGQTLLETETSLSEGARWLQALAAWRQGQREQAVDTLALALRSNRERRGHVFAWSRLWTPELLGLAVRSDIEADRAREIGRRVFGCGFEDDGSCVPLLGVRLLGGFALQVGEVCCGMEDVAPAPRRLVQLLAMQPGLSMTVPEVLTRMWPGIGTDSARSSLDAVLLRLRRLFATRFGPARYLVLGNGVLSLRHGRVDVVDLRMGMERAERLMAQSRPWQAEEALAEALSLVRGPVLTPDLNVPEGRQLELHLAMALERGAGLWTRLLCGQGRDADCTDGLLRLHSALPHHDRLTGSVLSALRSMPGSQHAEDDLVQTHELTLLRRGVPAADVERRLTVLRSV